MKSIINCLREFSGMVEDKRPTYMLKSGKLLTKNTAIFPLIPTDGATITTMGGDLLTFLSAKDDSKDDMKIYTDFLTKCLSTMEANYDGVDLVAQGDGDIVALGCVNGTSTSTTSTGNPSTPENLKYIYVDDAGEIKLSEDADKLSYGMLVISSNDPKVTVVKSGNTQLKITAADGSFIFADVVTGSKVIIQNQKEGDKINSSVVNFNPNGISPVASPKPVTIPQ